MSRPPTMAIGTSSGSRTCDPMRPACRTERRGSRSHAIYCASTAGLVGGGALQESIELAGDVALEFPESSSGGELPFCAVPGGVVDRVVVPAGPHDPQPGPSEDADGVGMVLAAAAGVGVDL